VLGTIGTRKAVFKACKNGILYAFDAATGEIIWYFNAPIIRRADWTPFHANSLLGSGPKDNGPMGNWDPSDIRTVTRRWPNDPDTGPYWRNPPATGGIEADIALAYGNVYVGAYNNPTYHRASPVEPNRPAAGGATGVPAPYTQKVNASIYAIDASTGRVKWSFNLDGVGFRGGITATGGMVFVPGLDGNLYALDANTGTVLFKKLVGTGLPIPPTIAADSKGKIKLFQVFGGSFSLWGSQQVPGALVAFGQPDTIPERVVTKEVVKEVPKEVIKEVVKEVPKEVIKEVPKEVIKTVTKEVIKEVPKEVIKEVPKEVTRTVTVETISPIAYAGIGIAIIVGVAVGVALGRRRKTA
jgi:outer membrane protein assembly factor BamB